MIKPPEERPFRNGTAKLWRQITSSFKPTAKATLSNSDEVGISHEAEESPTLQGWETAPSSDTRRSGAYESRQGAKPEYSRAFENFVDDSDDLVGLLAYAFYKSAIRESARQGKRSEGSNRNPNMAEVRAYRSHAERELSGVARRAIEDATPDIEQTATANAITNNRTEIIAHVTRRTGFWNAFGTNMLAWIASLFIAFLIIVVSSNDDAGRLLSDLFTGEGEPTLGAAKNPEGTVESAAKEDGRADLTRSIDEAPPERGGREQ